MDIPPALEHWPPRDQGPAIPTWRPDLLPTNRRRTPDVAFIPTSPEIVATMLEMAEIRTGDVLYDLGCGGGRIAVTAVKRYGIRAVGIDTDRPRFWKAAALAEASVVSHLVTLREADLLRADLPGATVVTFYFLPHLNDRLRPRLERLSPGTRIFSHAFGLWRIRPRQVERPRLASEYQAPVYLWEPPWKWTRGRRSRARQDGGDRV